MSEPLARHQVFEYREEEPFVVLNARNGNSGEEHTKSLLNHWHEEHEVAYIIGGASRHYIDGKCVRGVPGKAVVVNCGCLHNIIVDEIPEGEKKLRCIVVLISREFIEAYFPMYRSVVFTNDADQASPELAEAILKLHQYSKETERTEYDSLYVKSLLLMILYQLCRQGTCSREDAAEVNYQKNIERLRGMLQYVENHYAERITQAEVAEKFYFSKEYFSRFFKKSTGMTFTEHLTKYRVQKARTELLETSASILEIAMHNGFCDERGFINAFKVEYNLTPFQYRKMIKTK